MATKGCGILCKKCEVAIKEMKDNYKNPAFFFSEAAIVIQLEHPNIVELLAVITVEKPYCIITEFIPKRDLRTFFKTDQGKSLHFQDIVAINKQIVTGMLYIQQRSIVHKDLRIANILFESVNNVKIADFGLASILNNKADHCIDTEEALIPIKWSAPEAVLQKKFSFKSDVWSYGVVMYEIISYGREPYSEYSSSDVIEIMKKGQSMERPCNTKIKGQDSYYHLMLHCWEVIPEKRPTFAQVSSQLS